MKTIQTCTVAAFFLMAASAFAQMNYYVYETQDGDTKGFLARQNGISVSTLEAYNPELQDTAVWPNMALVIPKSTAGSDEIKTQIHKVKEGETLYALTRKYGVSLQAIKMYNPDINDRLQAGQKLMIPDKTKLQMQRALFLEKSASGNSGESESLENFTIHKVGNGETLFSIAKKHGVGIGDLKLANPELEERPEVGVELKVPEQTEAQKMRTAYGNRNKTIRRTLINQEKAQAAPAEPIESKKEEKTTGLKGW